MDQQYPRSPWYDQSLPHPVEPQQKTKKAKRRHLASKITALALCAALLATACVVAFLDPDGHPRFFRDPHADSEVSGESAGPAVGDSAGTGPGADGTQSGPAGAEDAYPDDFREFFNSYYSSNVIQELPPSRIEKAELHTDFRLELHGREGKPELSLQELYPACVDAVVSLQAKAYNNMLLIHSGTGFIVSDTGFIVTNQHVLSDTDTVTVTLSDGREYPGYLVGEDASTDIAVLKIPAKNLPYVELGDSDAVTVGDSVAAIGNPLGTNLNGTLTSGIISAIDRDINYNGRDLSLLQTTAALNEGNSGGPLFNQYGQVIGITNMKLSNAYSDVTIEGIGFAIPTATVKTVTDQLIATGKYSRPGLGITVGVIPAEIASHYDIPEGLYISAVADGSSAQEEGVRAGDILTFVNGFPVRQTTDVLDIRDTLSVGDEMTLTIFRDGETFDIVIILRELSLLY